MSLCWRRIRPGAYISTGLVRDFEVGQTVSGEWYYEGYGLDGIAATKAEAQAACQAHETARSTT